MRNNPKRVNKKKELETHHNQGMTPGAEARLNVPGRGLGKKKIVALQLDEKEQLALDYLGGIKALKELLCPVGLCIRCRENPACEETAIGAYCTPCATSLGSALPSS